MIKMVALLGADAGSVSVNVTTRTIGTRSRPKIDDGTHQTRPFEPKGSFSAAQDSTAQGRASTCAIVEHSQLMLLGPGSVCCWMPKHRFRAVSSRRFPSHYPVHTALPRVRLDSRFAPAVAVLEVVHTLHLLLFHDHCAGPRHHDAVHRDILSSGDVDGGARCVDVRFDGVGPVFARFGLTGRLVMPR